MHTRSVPRAGVSLVEVLVATMLLGGGVLAALQGTLRIARLRHDALARRDALLAAADRAARRSTIACAALADGTARGRGHVARWTVATDSTSATVREIVQLDQHGTIQSTTQLIPCVP
jgi:Tfp pilus assembly protein PilV